MLSHAHKVICRGGRLLGSMGLCWTFICLSPGYAMGLAPQDFVPHRVSFSNTNSYINISSGQYKRRSAMALEADFRLVKPLSFKTQLLLMPAATKNSQNVSVQDHHYWMNLALQYSVRKFVEFSFFSGPGIHYWRSIVVFQNSEQTYSGYQLGLVAGATATYHATLNWSAYLQGLYLNRFEDNKEDYCWGLGIGYLI